MVQLVQVEKIVQTSCVAGMIDPRGGEKRKPYSQLCSEIGHENIGCHDVVEKRQYYVIQSYIHHSDTLLIDTCIIGTG